MHATLEALGPSEIVETRFHGVWVTTHYNAENTIIGRFIEITWIPEILRAQRSDVADSLAMLETTLADEAKENHDRKREVTP